MNRRNFVRAISAGAAGMAGGAGVSAPALASMSDSEDLANSKLAGGVFYTKRNAGRWSNRVGGHLPRIDAWQASGGGLQVMVSNGHEMQGFEHYIVKHVLLDHDMNVIDEVRFDPRRDHRPVSQFRIDDYRGPLYALSVCNQHDTWLSTIEV